MRLAARAPCAVTLAAPLVVGCSAASDPAASTAPAASTSPSAAAASSPAATGTPEPSCPNPEGQACLGPLAAGTYTTRMFDPAITYPVPAGWRNYEDTPGNFLLVGTLRFGT
jgi:hypothetical protein